MPRPDRGLRSFQTETAGSAAPAANIDPLAPYLLPRLFQGTFMKAAAFLLAAVAAALLVAAGAQAASLKGRLDHLPAPVAGTASLPEGTEPPASPYEMAELAKRVEACAAKLDAKIERERLALTGARERFGGIKSRTAESLEAMEKESAAIKEALGAKAADKQKVADLTKRIRTEQQKAMFKRFVGEQMKKENEKLKVDLGLTPEQVVQFDKVSEEMFDKFAEVGSSFMDGEANPAKFTELVSESNGKMKAILSEEQFTRFTDYQQKRFGGGRQGNGDGQKGTEGSGGGGQ